MKKCIIPVLCFTALAFVAIATSSCNVTRRVTNESSFIQRGDTAVSITVRTVETYDAKKNIQ